MKISTTATENSGELTALQGSDRHKGAAGTAPEPCACLQLHCVHCEGEEPL